MTRILVDSSFLYALFARKDKNHAATRAFTHFETNSFVYPDIIIPEVCYLFERSAGHHAIPRFLQGFEQLGVEPLALQLQDIARCRAVMEQYATSKFDFVDCCIMALSERLNITRVCTFDRRDFPIFRPKHVEALELLP